MKNTSAITKLIYPIIEKQFDQKKVIINYKNNIRDFIEARSSSLYDIGPFDRIPFGKNDIDNFFKATGINIKDITKALSQTFYWNMNFNPRAAKDEYTVCMIMIIRYFLLHDNRKDAELSSIYLAFSGKFYPSIHSRKFPYPPSKNRHVMEYVINHELTMKYDIKREGSLFGAVRSICITWLNTYEKIFKDPDDRDCADLIQQLHGRIKSFLGNIADVFYKVVNDKDKYLSYDSDSEEESTYRIADNDSLKAERFVENTMNYIAMNSVDYALCRYASDSNVKADEVKSIIESIQDQPENIPLIKELLRITITEYLINSEDKSVTTRNFVAKSIVPKPNTKNPNIIRQKQIIETWLDENSPQYRKRKSREATKSSYHKSILTYYVFVINKANK